MGYRDVVWRNCVYFCLWLLFCGCGHRILDIHDLPIVDVHDLPCFIVASIVRSRENAVLS